MLQKGSNKPRTHLRRGAGARAPSPAGCTPPAWVPPAPACAGRRGGGRGPRTPGPAGGAAPGVGVQEIRFWESGSEGVQCFSVQGPGLPRQVQGPHPTVPTAPTRANRPNRPNCSNRPPHLVDLEALDLDLLPGPAHRHERVGALEVALPAEAAHEPSMQDWRVGCWLRSCRCRKTRTVLRMHENLKTRSACLSWASVRAGLGCRMMGLGLGLEDVPGWFLRKTRAGLQTGAALACVRGGQGSRFGCLVAVGVEKLGG
jgi:hypothetical protein